MESIHALRRTNQKHWQARLSCSNCLAPCSSKLLDPSGPELELTLSSYESDSQLSKDTTREFPLEFPPQETVDKQTEVKSEYKATERPQERSESDIKTDRKTSKSEKRSSKADKYPNPIDRYPCPLQSKCESKTEKSDKKAESRRESKAGSKRDSKAGSKRDSKAVSKAASKVEPRVDEQVEEVCCSLSRSTKSVKSDGDKDNSAAPSNIDSCFPPCYQDKAKDIAMGKEEKKKKSKTPKPPKSPKPPKEPKLEKKPSTKPKPKEKDKDKDKKKKPVKAQEKVKPFEPRKLKNYPTLTQIGGSVGHNCCSCLDAMALYIKEFLRFSCSLTAGRPAQDTQFQERVCDMLQILRALCRDCCYLARYVLRLLFVD